MAAVAAKMHRNVVCDSKLVFASPPPSPPWLGYTTAIATVAAVAVLRWELEVLVGPGLPRYIEFVPAVAISAVIGGVGPGVLATVLSALAIGLLFQEPAESLFPQNPVDVVGSALFVTINLVLSFFGSTARWQRAGPGICHRGEEDA